MPGNGTFLIYFCRSIPKLIYSREFSDGLMVIPSEEDSLLNHPDDVLGPLESYDEYGAYVPHQFVLRKEPQQQQYPNRRSHMNFPNGRHEVIRIHVFVQSTKFNFCFIPNSPNFITQKLTTPNSPKFSIH